LQPRRSALKSLTPRKAMAHVIAISVIRVSAARPKFHVVMRADGAEDDANANMSENLECVRTVPTDRVLPSIAAL